MRSEVEHAVGEVFREARAPDLHALPLESLKKLADGARQAEEKVANQIIDAGQRQREAAEAGEWAAVRERSLSRPPSSS